MMEKIANALSALTIMSCLFLKVPQIMHVKKRKSTEGINVHSLLMEITGFSIMCLYNFTSWYSILTYLEYPIILIQVYVLLYYVLKFKKLLNCYTYIGTGLYAVTCIAFMCGFLPQSILKFLVPFCTPLSGFAKVMYIYTIVDEGNADAVSLTTWVISLATNLSRVFTVYVDSADIALMFNFFVSSLLSSAVFFVALYYQVTCCNCDRKPRRMSKPHKNIRDAYYD